MLVEVTLTIPEGTCRSVSHWQVHPPLQSTPRLRTYTTSFSCDSQSFSRCPNCSFHFEILFLCASDWNQCTPPKISPCRSSLANPHLWFHMCLSDIFQSHVVRPGCFLRTGSWVRVLSCKVGGQADPRSAPHLL